MNGEFASALERLIDSFSREIADRIQQGLKRPSGSEDSPRLLDVGQAARYLGRTSNAIRHLISQGVLKAVRLDDRVYLDRRDLDALIERSKDGLELR